MSSLSSIIRAAAAGLAIKPRAEGEDPEDMEDDPPADNAEDDPNPDAEDDPENMEDDPPADAEDDTEDDEKTMSAADRNIFASGRNFERRRIASIMGAAEADNAPKLAAHLAFATDMSAKDARGMLKAGEMPPDREATGRNGGLRDRMQRAPNPQVGGGSGSGKGAKDQPSRIFAAATAMIDAKKNRAR